MRCLASSPRARSSVCLLFVLATAASACQAETAASNTAPAPAPAPAPAGGGGSIILNSGGEQPAQPAQPSTCTAQLVVTNIQRRASCTIDERVSGHPGVLTYACGDGPAQASFGATQFRGEVRGGALTLEIETQFPFSDGCQWSSKQRIVGSIATRALAYEYLEAPLPGQQRCAPACSASGSVVMQ